MSVSRRVANEWCTCACMMHEIKPAVRARGWRARRTVILYWSRDGQKSAHRKVGFVGPMLAERVEADASVSHLSGSPFLGCVRSKQVNKLVSVIKYKGIIYVMYSNYMYSNILIM